MRAFFGERWDAPIVDDAVQYPTPVGEKCMWCDQVIVEGDRGLFTTMITAEGNGLMVQGHMECELPSVFGGPRHMRGECTHAGSCMDGYTDRRELGRAVLAELNKERAARGQDPM